MRKLKEEISKNGFLYKLYKRNDVVAWFKQFTKDGMFISNEVFKIKISRPCTIKNKDGEVIDIEEGERFPSDESFGIWAYSIRDEYRAEEKFKYISELPIK